MFILKHRVILMSTVMGKPYDTTLEMVHITTVTCYSLTLAHSCMFVMVIICNMKNIYQKSVSHIETDLFYRNRYIGFCSYLHQLTFFMIYPFSFKNGVSKISINRRYKCLPV